MLKHSLNYLNRKLKLIQFAGGSEAAQPHRTAIYLVGASIAEFFADVLLTPCEAVRIRLVSDSKYASGFLPAFARMAKEGGAREMCMSFYPLRIHLVADINDERCWLYTYPRQADSVCCWSIYGERMDAWSASLSIHTRF